MRLNVMRLTFLLAVILQGCSGAEVESLDELRRYLADPAHQLTQEKEANGIKCVAQYRPTDVILYQHAADITSTGIDSLRSRFDDKMYFVLSLSKDGREALHQLDNYSEYSSVLHTLSFEMNMKVKLITDKNTSRQPLDFALNRTYGIDQATDLLFVFDRKDLNDSEWIEFRVAEFGLGLGDLAFTFLMSDIEKTPRLKIAEDTSVTL
jgi:hypothetical protein